MQNLARKLKSNKSHFFLPVFESFTQLPSKAKDMKALAVISLWLFVFMQIALPIRVDLDSEDPKDYAKFLEEVRNEFKEPGRTYHGLPMTKAPPQPATFVLVELQATPEISITLALNKSNLYVMAYQDRYQGKPRAHFFEDAPENAKTGLFSEAKGKLRKTIYCKTSYGSIEGKLRGSRKKLGLGIRKLKSLVEAVYGSEINEATQAKFLLVSIQMVSEAARFKYIEKQVVDGLRLVFNPDFKVISLEEKWSKISEAIFESNPEGKFKSTLHLKNKSDQDWPVTEVKQIAPDVSLLLYMKDKKFEGSSDHVAHHVG